jgi:hypothetical protein
MGGIGSPPMDGGDRPPLLPQGGVRSRNLCFTTLLSSIITFLPSQSLVTVLTANPMQHRILSVVILLLVPVSLSAKDNSAPKRKKLIVSTQAWTGEKLPAYPSGQPEISVLKVTIPPGQRLPMHKHPFINAAVVVRGELTVTTDKGRVLHVKSGEQLI